MGHSGSKRPRALEEGGFKATDPERQSTGEKPVRVPRYTPLIPSAQLLPSFRPGEGQGPHKAGGEVTAAQVCEVPRLCQAPLHMWDMCKHI